MRSWRKFLKLMFLSPFIAIGWILADDEHRIMFAERMIEDWDLE